MNFPIANPRNEIRTGKFNGLADWMAGCTCTENQSTYSSGSPPHPHLLSQSLPQTRRAIHEMRRYSRIQLLPLNPSRINREQRDPPSSRNLLLLFYDDSAAAAPVFRARPTTFEQPMIPIVTPSVSRSSK